jgi:hypothetical protein
MVPETEITTELQPDGALKIEQPPSGPVVTIGSDGKITVNRGLNDEAARLFWDAVQIQGQTYRDRINEMQQIIQTLGNDPYRDAVLDPYEVYHALPKNTKRTFTFMDVKAVLETITEVARKRIQ